MNAFQRKSLYTALAGASALGVATGADAVNLNPNGLGQVLIYPYYTTRGVATGNNFDSLLTVVNSTATVKVMKVRFLESLNSREVIDFNLYLSAFDVWTGAVAPSPVTAGGRLIVTDHSCTVPPISTSQGGAGYVDFVNYAYTGSASDKGGDSLDRTNEGYVEIIEMGTFTATSTIGVAVTHVNGTPPCTPLSDTLATREISSNTGGLFGGMTLINVNEGVDFSESAVALDHFSGGGRLAIDGGYTPSGTASPNLTNATSNFGGNPVSQVLENGNIYSSTWVKGTADAASAVLMHNEVLNVFVLEPTTKSLTDWVVTFPTKRFYVNVGTGPAVKLFQSNFNSTVGACDDVGANLFDREEFKINRVSFSPPPPSGRNSLCYEANVITFNSANPGGVSGNVGAHIFLNIPTAFSNGWMDLFFTGTSVPTIAPPVHQLINVTNTAITTIGGGTTAGHTTTYNGLPVVGFEAETYNNATLIVGGVNVRYGGEFVHNYRDLVQ